jgi:hypothetical protein
VRSDETGLEMRLEPGLEATEVGLDLNMQYHFRYCTSMQLTLQGLVVYSVSFSYPLIFNKGEVA